MFFFKVSSFYKESQSCEISGSHGGKSFAISRLPHYDSKLVCMYLLLTLKCIELLDPLASKGSTFIAMSLPEDIIRSAV
jgi:hypothetical protein